MSRYQNTGGSFTGEFAKLVPHNRAAQLLFSKTYVYVGKNDDTFHLKFMENTGNESVVTSDEPVESSTDYDSQPTDTQGSETTRSQVRGHFVLSFKEQRSPEMPNLGWRVGKGSSKFSLPNRNVDLLLARPGDVGGASLASVHMVFHFNRRSGFLMLKGCSTKAPVGYRRAGVWEELKYEQEQNS